MGIWPLIFTLCHKNYFPAAHFCAETHSWYSGSGKLYPSSSRRWPSVAPSSAGIEEWAWLVLWVHRDALKRHWQKRCGQLAFKETRQLFNYTSCLSDSWIAVTGHPGHELFRLAGSDCMQAGAQQAQDLTWKSSQLWTRTVQTLVPSATAQLSLTQQL